MKKVIITISIIIVSLLIFTSSVYAVEDDGGDGTGSTEDEGVIVPTEGDGWLDEVFGEGGLNLNIMKPLAFWDMEGTASIWSIVSYIYTFFSAILFIGFIVAIAIGVMKWMSSQGDESLVQAARKWITNAIMGFAAVIGVFVLVNFVTWLLGVGSVFDLGQNLAVCGEGKSAEVLFEWKKENNMLDATNCTCVSGSWDCDP